MNSMPSHSSYSRLAVAAGRGQQQACAECVSACGSAWQESLSKACQGVPRRLPTTAHSPSLYFLAASRQPQPLRHLSPANLPASHRNPSPAASQVMMA